MKKVKSIVSFAISLIVITISVVILVVVSIFSMVFNGILFILMVSGLALPMIGNTLANKFLGKKEEKSNVAS